MVLKRPVDRVGLFAPLALLVVSVCVVLAPLFGAHVPDAHRAVAALCSVLSLALLFSNGGRS